MDTRDSIACGDANEGGVVELSCALGQVIKHVIFASFGQPQGYCSRVGNFRETLSNVRVKSHS